MRDAADLACIHLTRRVFCKPQLPRIIRSNSGRFENIRMKLQDFKI